MKPIVRVAFESIRAASKILIAEQRRLASISVDYQDKLEIARKIDTISEERLIDFLSTKYPESKFISEESFQKEELTDEPTWVIDPLDGTHNYINYYGILRL